MPAETPQGAVGKDAPSSLSHPQVVQQLLMMRGHVTDIHFIYAMADIVIAKETAETQLAEARAEIERLLGGIVDLRNRLSHDAVHGRISNMRVVEELLLALLDSGSKENEEAPSNRDEAPE